MRPSAWLDLELETDRAKLAQPEDYFERHRDELVVIDEIQRAPELLPILRAVVDRRRKSGDRIHQYLLLGSASRELLRHSAESLAGRIEYLELDPFSIPEIEATRELAGLDRLWLRGGFPESYLADSDAASLRWRDAFVATFIEREIPVITGRAPSEQMRRFWRMLANLHGELWNASKIATGIGVTGVTIRAWLDLLSDLYVVRQLQPWAGNSTKRLVRSPKVFFRDSGLAHALLGIEDIDGLLGHPVCGHSFEGFVIQQFLAMLPRPWEASFYRSAAGAEIDLVLEGPKKRVVAIEIKRGIEREPPNGFLLGCEDVGATERYVVMPSTKPYSLGQETEAIGVFDLVMRFASEWK